MDNLISPSRRLLFVDDEDGIRATFPLILQGHGFDVKSAASVQEALHKIQSQTFDILLSDLNIVEPRDGYAVVRAMRQANPRCIAIILTGYPDLDSAVEGIRHEIDDYFVKPADIDSLVAAMEGKLAQRYKA
ncbi:MAG TPA: response regulator [Terriglobales bacterium]|nr:response regulator [Terriglobales bacterium]